MKPFLGRDLPLLILAFALGRFLTLGFSLAGLPNAALYHLYEDDSFYFLEIAWNWAHGLGSSFDGLGATNGYQPLWQWMLVPVAALSEDRADFAARFQMLVTLVHGAAALGLFAAVRRVSHPWAGTIAAILLLFAPGAALLSRGMESALYGGLLCASFLQWTALARPSSGDRRAGFAVLGLLIALTTLARLEAGLLVLILGATVALDVLRGRERPGALVVLVASTSLLLVPYLVGNRLVFGDWMPVSVVMKSGQGNFRASLMIEWAGRIFADGGLPVALGVDRWWQPEGEARRRLALVHAAVLFTATILVCVRGLRRSFAAGSPRSSTDATRLDPAAAMPFLLFLCLHAGIVGSGSAAEWPVAWHFVPEILAMAAFAGLVLGTGVPRVLGRLPEDARRITLLLGLPATIAGAGLLVFPLLQPVSPTRWMVPGNAVEATRWIERELPELHRVGSFDSGFFGWALDVPVVNLDGVANDFAYLREVHLPKRHLDYLRREGITHLVNLAPRGAPRGDSFRRIPLDGLRELRRFEDFPDAAIVLFEVLPAG